MRADEVEDALEWLATDMEYAARRGTEDDDLERWRATVREVRAALSHDPAPTSEEP